MLALGVFVHAFARAEGVLHNLLRHHARLSPGAAAALFAGVRMKSAMDAMRRLFEVRGNTTEAEALDRPFKHLNDISSIRDDLLHFGAEEDVFGELFVTNASRKHLPKKATTRRISAADLHAMTVDLDTIRFHFIASVIRRSRWDSGKFMQAFDRARQRPWRYRPRSPIGLPDRSP